MFSTFPHLSFGSGSEDSESSNESPPPPTFPGTTKPPPDLPMFSSYTWDLQDLAVKLLQCQRDSPSQSAAMEEQVATFDSSVPPPGFVTSINSR